LDLGVLKFKEIELHNLLEIIKKLNLQLVEEINNIPSLNLIGKTLIVVTFFRVVYLYITRYSNTMYIEIVS